MKYTIKEQNKIANINKELKRLEKIKLKKIEKIQLVEKEIDKLTEIEDKIRSGIYKIDENVVKRCKHIGGKHRVRNWRDDASFLYWIRCDDCGETVGHEGENAGHY